MTSIPIDWGSFTKALGKRESGGKYSAVNSIGYVGKYQFGLAALVDIGLVKRSYAGKGNSALKNPDAWKGDMDLDTFLSSPEVQEEAMERYTEINYDRLQGLGVLDEESSAEDIAGALAAAHLKGPRGARDLILNNRDNKDAYGSRASEYLNLGRRSQKIKRLA